MRYISLFSGIEAASVAWQPLGWEAVAFSEIDKFPSAVLEYHYPTVPNLGDIKQIDWSDYHGTADVVIGGSPCQAFSVAGLRKGLADPRGNLMLEYLRAVADIQPKWCIWENVPGVLSVDAGRTFGTLLGAMVELGYGFAYRILNAQYFGVAQRRRRVYLVASCDGDWRRAAAVLFNNELCSRDFETVARERERTSEDAEGSIGNSCFKAVDYKTGMYLETECAGPLTCGSDKTRSAPLVVCAAPGFSKRRSQQLPTRDDGLSYALTTGAPPNVCYALQGSMIGRAEKNGPQGCGVNEDISFTLNTTDRHAVAFSSGSEYVVRKMTPEECESLQGFPRGWTRIPYRGKSAEECPDSPRYKACGNSMAVPVIRWLGQRIQEVEAETSDEPLPSISHG